MMVERGFLEMCFYLLTQAADRGDTSELTQPKSEAEDTKLSLP